MNNRGHQLSGQLLFRRRIPTCILPTSEIINDLKEIAEVWVLFL